MDVRVLGSIPPDPFLSAADLFETEYDLDRPVRVRIRNNPDTRTWAAHYPEYHVLNISRSAATSLMARELALHEYAHMARHEEGHPSHHQSTDEAIYLGLAGRSVERRRITHCYQIANHMKDIYADDLTLDVAPGEKLIAFLEAKLGDTIADRSRAGPSFVAFSEADHDGRLDSSTIHRHSVGADPEITAVNAAFALALVERHGLVDRSHPLYDLARLAERWAPAIDLDRFKEYFRSLGPDPSESQYRKTLVDVTREYAIGPAAAD